MTITVIHRIIKQFEKKFLGKVSPNQDVELPNVAMSTTKNVTEDMTEGSMEGMTEGPTEGMTEDMTEDMPEEDVEYLNSEIFHEMNDKKIYFLLKILEYEVNKIEKRCEKKITKKKIDKTESAAKKITDKLEMVDKWISDNGNLSNKIIKLRNKVSGALLYNINKMNEKIDDKIKTVTSLEISTPRMMTAIVDDECEDKKLTMVQNFRLMIKNPKTRKILIVVMVTSVIAVSALVVVAGTVGSVTLGLLA